MSLAVEKYWKIQAAHSPTGSFYALLITKAHVSAKHEVKDLCESLAVCKSLPPALGKL